MWRPSDAALTDLGPGAAIAVNTRDEIIGASLDPSGHAILWRPKN